MDQSILQPCVNICTGAVERVAIVATKLEASMKSGSKRRLAMVKAALRKNDLRELSLELEGAKSSLSLAYNPLSTTSLSRQKIIPN